MPIIVKGKRRCELCKILEDAIAVRGGYLCQRCFDKYYFGMTLGIIKIESGELHDVQPGR